MWLRGLQTRHVRVAQGCTHTMLQIGNCLVGARLLA